MPLVDEIVELAHRLIKFESIAARPEETAAAVDFVEEYLRGKTRLIVKRFESAGKPSLAATFRKTKTPRLFFHDHLDVVPGKPEQFQPFIKEGRLFGRGASDTKGNGAVLLVLAKELSRLENPPDIGFLFTADEEIGGGHGTRFLLGKGYRCRFFMTMEPTGFNIVPAHKGVLWLTVKVKGKNAHSSRPWQGENAVLKAVDGLGELYQTFPTPPKEAWLTTVNVGKIEAGDAFNRVPDRCTLSLDIRYIDGKDRERVLKEVRRCFPEAKVEVLMDEAGMSTDLRHPYVLRLASLVKKVTGRQPSIHRGHGACDGRFYSAAGIPAVQFGTASKGLHTDTEYLKIAALENFYRVLYELIRSGI